MNINLGIMPTFKMTVWLVQNMIAFLRLRNHVKSSGYVGILLNLYYLVYVFSFKRVTDMFWSTVR